MAGIRTLILTALTSALLALAASNDTPKAMKLKFGDGNAQLDCTETTCTGQNGDETLSMGSKISVTLTMKSGSTKSQVKTLDQFVGVRDKAVVYFGSTSKDLKCDGTRQKIDGVQAGEVHLVKPQKTNTDIYITSFENDGNTVYATCNHTTGEETPGAMLCNKDHTEAVLQAGIRVETVQTGGFVCAWQVTEPRLKVYTGPIQTDKTCLAAIVCENVTLAARCRVGSTLDCENMHATSTKQHLAETRVYPEPHGYIRVQGNTATCAIGMFEYNETFVQVKCDTEARKDKVKPSGGGDTGSTNVITDTSGDATQESCPETSPKIFPGILWMLFVLPGIAIGIMLGIVIGKKQEQKRRGYKNDPAAMRMASRGGNML